MKKIGDSTNTANAAGEWTEGNPAAGLPATLLKADWLNTIQRELINVLIGAGIPLNKADDSQLLKAIQAIQAAASTWAKLTGKPTTVSGFGITDAYTKVQANAAFASSGHTHTFASLTGRPTTLAGYGVTDAYTRVQADAAFASSGHTHTFASLTGKPTTLAGYGVTDAYTRVQANAAFASSGHTHTFASLTGTPTTLSGYGITDAVRPGDYGLGVPLNLPAASNLNTMVKLGTYLYSSGAALNNAPVTGAASLTVVGRENYPHQEFRRVYQNRLFFRAAKITDPSTSAADWLPWVESLHTGNHISATLGEAQAGESSSVWMTPLRVFQAMRSAAAVATEALLGVMRIGSQVEVDAGGLGNVAVTPATLRKHSSMGVGQTWQNVMSSRSLNTTYTNTTGRPIGVSVSLRDEGSYFGAIYVSGVQIGSWDQPSSIGYTQTFIVPPGGTYMVSGNGGSAGGNTLVIWTELR